MVALRSSPAARAAVALLVEETLKREGRSLAHVMSANEYLALYARAEAVLYPELGR
jgi:hypothetical protein